jgi:HAD superfamily hydrolase (TIGR01450 family)
MYPLFVEWEAGGPVGVVGLGAMGSRLARRLLETGCSVSVWNRTPDKARSLADCGAVVADTPSALAAGTRHLITMISDPEALRSVFLGETGIMAGLRSDATVIEMSTIGPEAVAWLRSQLPSWISLLDAPVQGSIGQAESGELTLFVGGPEPVVQRLTPLLSSLGTIIRAGDLGAGAAAKLLANASLFVAVSAVGELIALGRGLGLEDDVLHQVLAATPFGAEAERRRPLLDRDDYPARFSLALAGKDARLILDGAKVIGKRLPLVEAAHSWLAQAEVEGRGDRDYTSILGTITGLALRPRSDCSIASFDGLILDLDGVVRLGSSPVDGAVEAVAALRNAGVQILFMTNDPRSSSEQQAELRRFGIPATAGDVITASAAAASYLRSRLSPVPQSVFVIGPPSLKVELEAQGLEVLGPAHAAEAHAVVVAAHEGFDYGELAAATSALAKGVQFVATGRDATAPTGKGPVPGTGAVVAAVEAATGRRATVVGKPEPHMFEAASVRLSACRRVAVVGDSLMTDIVGARRAGLAGILVLSGTTRRWQLEAAPVKPDLVFDDLSALAVARSEVRRTDMEPGRDGNGG